MIPARVTNGNYKRYGIFAKMGPARGGYPPEILVLALWGLGGF